MESWSRKVSEQNHHSSLMAPPQQNAIPQPWADICCTLQICHNLAAALGSAQPIWPHSSSPEDLGGLGLARVYYLIGFHFGLGSN